MSASLDRSYAWRAHGKCALNPATKSSAQARHVAVNMNRARRIAPTALSASASVSVLSCSSVGPSGAALRRSIRSRDCATRSVASDVRVCRFASDASVCPTCASDRRESSAAWSLDSSAWTRSLRAVCDDACGFRFLPPTGAQ